MLRARGYSAYKVAGQTAKIEFDVELRGIEPLTFSMRKTGTGVDCGCFRTSRAISGRLGTVSVGVVAVLLCSTAARLAVGHGTGLGASEWTSERTCSGAGRVAVIVLNSH
jgi:hypothetical protein